MKKIQHQNVLPTRFRLRKDVLGNIGVHVFASSWRSEADNLARELSGADKKAKTNLFNQAVLSLSPVLVHGFRYTGKVEGTALYQMLALEQYPGEALVKSLAKHWADVWLETSYPNLSQNHLSQYTQRLYDSIEGTGKGWVERSALDALSDENNYIRFSALPSLIAARFAATGLSQINGRTIKWGLVQQGDNGLAVVSEPQSSEKEGTFAYLIKFNLQFQPGNPEPWIYTSFTCQRYMDKPLESGNKDRNATILLRLSRPLQYNWAHNQTLVRLPVWKVPRKSAKHSEAPRFPDGFHTLLDRAQAREIIRDPALILNDPTHYRTGDDDNYYVLYAEGYEPGHPLGSGFGARERTEIFRDLEEKLNNILIPGNAIPLFQGGIESHALAAWKTTEDKAPKDPAKKRDMRLDSLRAAAGGRTIRILLVSVNDDMAKAMRYFLVDRHLKIADGKALPDDFQVLNIQIPDSLCRPLEISDDANLTTSAKRLEAQKGMAEEWRKFLREYKGVNGERTLAWIELPPDSYDFVSPHDAIRMACVKEDIASQMINKLQSRYELLIDMGKHFSHPKANFDFGRLYNACGDLILRQLGVATGDTKESSLPDDYQRAGFAPEVASKLVVIGLTIFRNNQDNYRGRGSVNIPIAVRILPGGKVEAKIPTICDWMDYFDVCIALGNAFIRNQRKESVNIDSATMFKFVQGILAEYRETPSIMILDAYKLRSDWKALTVSKIEQDQLALGGDIYESFSLPNMNVVWVRQHADGETPQYVATDERTWAEADDADRIAHTSLFEDTDAKGDLKHFFSVGRLDNNKKVDQAAMRHEDGDKMNFRNQQMLELVPIMGKDGAAAVTAVHMLRSSPAWGIGNTAMPYPIHLANTMVKNMLPLLGVEDYGEAES